MAITIVLPSPLKTPLQIPQTNDIRTDQLPRKLVRRLYHSNAIKPDDFSSYDFRAAIVVGCAWLAVYILIAVHHWTTSAG